MKTEAKSGVLHPKARDPQGLLAAAGNWEGGVEWILPPGLQKEPPTIC